MPTPLVIDMRAPARRQAKPTAYRWSGVSPGPATGLVDVTDSMATLKGS